MQHTSRNPWSKLSGMVVCFISAGTGHNNAKHPKKQQISEFIIQNNFTILNSIFLQIYKKLSIQKLFFLVFSKTLRIFAARFKKGGEFSGMMKSTCVNILIISKLCQDC